MHRQCFTDAMLPFRLLNGEPRKWRAWQPVVLEMAAALVTTAVLLLLLLLLLRRTPPQQLQSLYVA